MSDYSAFSWVPFSFLLSSPFFFLTPIIGGASAHFVLFFFDSLVLLFPPFYFSLPRINCILHLHPWRHFTVHFSHDLSTAGQQVAFLSTPHGVLID